jgi:hypothetical protein
MEKKKSYSLICTHKLVGKGGKRIKAKMKWLLWCCALGT